MDGGVTATGVPQFGEAVVIAGDDDQWDGDGAQHLVESDESPVG
jgi:hypothetical protein